MKGERRPGRVVVAGGTNLDIQGVSDGPFAARDSNPGAIRSTPGGVGRNIAENCARLGMEVSLISAFGRDDAGRRLREDAESLGIDTSACLVAEGRSSSYLCLLSCDGSLQGAVSDMEIMRLLTPARLASSESLLAGADFIVADTNLPEESIVWLAEKFGRGARAGRGPRIFLDTVSMAKAPRAGKALGGFDCAKPNLAEAEILAGRGEPPPGLSGRERAERAALALARKSMLPADIFISLGEDGIYYSCGGGERGIVPLPGRPDGCDAKNRSGAGDAACAALVWGEWMGFGPARRAKLALAAAMMTAASERTVSENICAASLEGLASRLFGEDEDESLP